MNIDPRRIVAPGVVLDPESRAKRTATRAGGGARVAVTRRRVSIRTASAAKYVLVPDLRCVRSVRDRLAVSERLVIYPRTRQIANANREVSILGLEATVVEPFADVGARDLPLALEDDLGGYDESTTVLVLDCVSESIVRRLRRCSGRWQMIVADARWRTLLGPLAEEWRSLHRSR